MRCKPSSGGCGVRWGVVSLRLASMRIQVRATTRQRSGARSSPRHGELVSDRLVRFPGQSWQEIEALPQPLRWTVERTIFHLLDEPGTGDDSVPGGSSSLVAGAGQPVAVAVKHRD